MFEDTFYQSSLKEAVDQHVHSYIDLHLREYKLKKFLIFD